ncbi:MAG: hypothetical protein RLZZ511_2002 [Cyanobacteriota bacterium]|jgi:type I restriction enzyme S subunit
MDLQTFWDDFEIIAEAPGGIAKLRALILDLAVRGKLVPQDAKDEPAGKALEKIANEKLSIIEAEGYKSKNKKAKTSKSYEVEFELPNGWTLIELDQVCIFIDYRGQTPSKTTSGIRLITAKNVRDGFIKSDPEEFVSEETYHSWMTRGFPKEGDVLFTTEAPLGKASVVNLKERFALAQRVINLQPVSDLNGYFLMWLILSPWFQRELQLRATGMTATGIKAAKLKVMQIPLPPLAEQKRIVAKVDELMALCDRYEAAKATRDTLRQNLRKSAIDALMNAPDDRALKDAWSIVQENWVDLSQEDEDVEILRKLILELAIRGKLSSPDTEDTSVQDYVDRVKQKFNDLQKQKKINKQKMPLPLLDNFPYDLPSHWTWQRFVEVAAIQSNLVKPDDYGTSPHIAPNYIEKDTGKLLPYKTIAEDQVTSPKHLFYPGQILYSKIRPNLNKVVIVDFEGLCSADMYPIESGIYSRYMLLYMLSQPFLEQVTSGDNRLAMPKVNQEQLSQVMIAVPPLPEQKRIVAKVEQLMTLCDTLETQLQTTQAKAKALAGAVSGLVVS